MTSATVTAPSVARARAGRVEHELSVMGLQGALLFQPGNVEFATGYDVNLDVGLGRPARCALVTIGGEPVIWEHPGVIRVTELTGDSTRSRRARDVSELWGSQDPDAAAFADDVCSLLTARHIDGPIGIDEVSVHLLEALSPRGIVVRDANAALRRARAVSSAAEIEGFRDAVTRARSAIAAAAATIRPGVDTQTLSSALMKAAIERGASEWLVAPAASQALRAGQLVPARCCARWETGYLVDIVRMLPCGQVDAEKIRLLDAGTEMLDALLSRIGPGTSLANVAAQARALVPSGCEVSRDHPLLHGCGLDYEHPILGWRGGNSDELRVGMVLSVGFELIGARGSVILLREQVAVTDTGCVPLRPMSLKPDRERRGAGY
jgi:Xaa-Pro aminopeptidase